VNKLTLKDFAKETETEVSELPIYSGGEILKLTKGLRQARKTEVKHVLVTRSIDDHCKGCLFAQTRCSTYLSVRCMQSERYGQASVIFVPCLESGELL
jgi:hypothetical protein